MWGMGCAGVAATIDPSRILEVADRLSGQVAPPLVAATIDPSRILEV